MKTSEKGSWQARIRRNGKVVFGCTVTRRDAAWFITDCMPQRRDPLVAAMLLEVCERLVTDHGATNIVAVHPEFWGERLSAGGAMSLQRLVPMWLGLDNDLLRLPVRPLSPGYDLVPLNAVVGDHLALRNLGDSDHDGDLHVWRETLGGDYGPLIPAGSLIVLVGSTPCAAVAVTDFQGAPLLAHLVVAEGHQGIGLGRALLVHSLRALAEAGYVDSQLNVDEDNWVANRLFRSVGYVQNQPTQQVSHLWGRRHSHAHR
jgi:GNAT superfamily N-acetyltransferase